MSSSHFTLEGRTDREHLLSTYCVSSKTLRVQLTVNTGSSSLCPSCLPRTDMGSSPCIHPAHPACSDAPVLWLRSPQLHLPLGQARATNHVLQVMRLRAKKFRILLSDSSPVHTTLEPSNPRHYPSNPNGGSSVTCLMPVPISLLPLLLRQPCPGLMSWPRKPEIQF